MFELIELNKKLIIELREIAKKLEIQDFESLKKPELIQKILDNQKPAEVPVETPVDEPKVEKAPRKRIIGKKITKENFVPKENNAPKTLTFSPINRDLDEPRKEILPEIEFETKHETFDLPVENEIPFNYPIENEIVAVEPEKIIEQEPQTESSF